MDITSLKFLVCFQIEVNSQHQPTYNSCDLIEDDKDVLQLETETQQDLSDSLHPKEVLWEIIEKGR